MKPNLAKGVKDSGTQGTKGLIAQDLVSAFKICSIPVISCSMGIRDIRFGKGVAFHLAP